MTTEISTRELFRSCEILFGPGLDLSEEFLAYLQPGGVKSAFRRRAMETHPDRYLAGSDRTPVSGAGMFPMVHEAYTNLLRFLQQKDSRSGPPGGQPRPAPQPAARPYTAPPRRTAPTQGATRQSPRRRPIILPEGYPTASPGSLHQGPLPKRRLLFGHFLYYSGLASWRTVARILMWQRQERPRLGELGKRWGLLDDQDIAAILRWRRSLHLFGETAERLGLLDTAQIKALMIQQRRLQKKFGTILVEKNCITPYELQDLLVQFERHNRSFPPLWRN